MTNHSPTNRSRARGIRRGTVLLMVIGVLALLSIIAVVYATIGRSDRATTASLVRQTRVQDRSDEIVEYAKQVLSDGVFPSIRERDGRGGSVGVRRVFDYPVVDPQMLSIDIGNPTNRTNEANRISTGLGYPSLTIATSSLYERPNVPLTADPFNAAGSIFYPWQDPNTPDVRNFGTPFLASMEPAYLSHLIGSTDAAARNDALAPGHPFANRRDWAHISVISPDGRFVNLANLRNNFDAESGWIDLTNPEFRADGTPKHRMSDGLTLYYAGSSHGGNTFTGRSYDLGRPTDSLAQFSNSWLRQSVPVRENSPSRFAHPMRVADWSDNQVWAFRPMIDTEFDPGQYAYLFNQWADADGDGIADSRLFELVDASLAFGGTTDARTRSLITTDGRMRYFAAARVIDASAMINVNTATDFTRMPGQEPFTNQYSRDHMWLPGVTPADVDVRRVLMGLDFNYDYADFLQSEFGGVGLVGLPHPITADDLGDYRGYDAQASLRLGAAGPLALQSSLMNGSLNHWAAGLTTTPLGRNGIGAQLEENFTGQLTPTPETADPVAPGRVPRYPGSVSPKMANFRARDYLKYGGRAGRLISEGNPASADGLLTSFSQGFGMDDELELRTFNGVNNDATTSPLEAVIGGRDPNVAFWLSPLRDNRPLSVEMQGREYAGDRPYRQFFGRPGAPDEATMIVPDGIAARRNQVLLSIFGDVRHLLTTRSGARPLVESTNTGPLNDNDVATDLTGVIADLRMGAPRWNTIDLPGQAEAMGQAETISRFLSLDAMKDFYLRSLIPFTNPNPQSPRYPSLWPDYTTLGAGGPTDLKMFEAAGLAYGGRAEVAARMSVHAALNLADMVDIDWVFGASSGQYLPDAHEPTAVSFIIGSPMNAANRYDASLDYIAQMNTGGNPSEQYRLPFPRMWLPRDIAPYTNPSELSQRIVDNVAQARAINVFGVEPQPFISEAMSLYLYADAPVNAGGDDEYIAPPNPGDTPPPAMISVNLSPSLTNQDFLGEIVAVQVTNPFEEPLILYRPNALTQARNDRRSEIIHYFKIGKRYFLLAEQEFDSYAINAVAPLQPGETRVFYAINPGTRQKLYERIKRVAEGRPDAEEFTRTDFDAFIENQFGARAVQMPMVNPLTFAAVNDNSTDEADLWSVNTLPTDRLAAPYNERIDENERRQLSVVSMYRVMRTAQSPLFGMTGDLNRAENDPENDLLIDRLRDPTPVATHAEGGLFGIRPSDSAGNEDISGTEAGEESSDDTIAKDNTGFSFALWATVRRPTGEMNGTSPGFIDGGKPRLGILPPWCIENKSDNSSFAGATYRYGPTPSAGRSGRVAQWSLNFVDSTEIDDEGEEMNYSDSGGTNSRFTKLTNLLDATTAFNPDIKKSAYIKTGNPMPRNFDGRTDPANRFKLRREYIEVAPEYHSVGYDDRASVPDAMGNRKPTSRNAGLFSRVGDLLLPLAIGPWQDPLIDAMNPATGAPTTVDDNGWINDPRLTDMLNEEYRWTCLSEALALSTGYYSPASGTQSDPARNIFENFGLSTDPLNNFTVREGSARTDRGHFRLDAFTPYRPLGTNPTYPFRAFGTEPIGTGIPMALNVFSRGRVTPGIASTYDVTSFRSSIPAVEVISQPGGIAQAVPGQINLNTASTTVLSAVPMLRPAPAVDRIATGTNVTSTWMTEDVVSSNLFGNTQPAPTLFVTPVLGSQPSTTNNFEQRYDIASGVRAYADKSSQRLRPYIVAGGGTPEENVDFSTVLNPGTTPTDALPQPIRTQRTRVEKLREGLGIRSLGELLAINYTSDQTNNRLRPDVSMTRMGLAYAPNVPVKGSDHPFIHSTRFYNRTVDGDIDASGSTLPGNAVRLTANDTAGSYESKLVIANAAAASSTVRSDIFVVYLLIQGYTPEDTIVNDDPQSGPIDPMVPTVERRLMMVVDRSNVINPGDEPKVLMIQELPVRP